MPHTFFCRNLYEKLPLSANNVLTADVTLNKSTAQKVVLGNNNGQNRWCSMAAGKHLGSFDTDPGEESTNSTSIETTIEDRVNAKSNTLKYLFLIDGDQAMGSTKTLLQPPFCDSTLFTGTSFDLSYSIGEITSCWIRRCKLDSFDMLSCQVTRRSLFFLFVAYLHECEGEPMRLEVHSFYWIRSTPVGSILLQLKRMGLKLLIAP